MKVNKWTSSLGLMPYTDVNFSFQYPDYVKDPSGAVVDTLTTQESGSGGLTQVYWSNGVRLTKDIAVGLKAAYFVWTGVKSLFKRVDGRCVKR
jgi:hypothetical protein